MGDTFVLQGSARDLRRDGAGVFAAYTDVTYDQNLVAVDGSLEISNGFPAGRSGDIEVEGLIDEVGGFREIRAGNVNASQELLFEIPFVARSGGEVLFATNPTELIPAHDVLVLGSDFPVLAEDIEFGYIRLQIGDPLLNPASPWRNPNHPFDVNDDGVVSRADGRIIDESLEAGGERELLAPSPGNSPPPFLDATGDGYVRQDDADLVYAQFAAERPEPAPSPNAAPRPGILELLQEYLAQYEDDALQVRLEIVNTRTGEADSPIKVGDIVQVRGYLGELSIDTQETFRSTLWMVLVTSSEARVLFDPEVLSLGPANHEFFGESPIEQIRETGESRLMSFQFIAKQAGTTALATQFHDDPGSDGLALFQPFAARENFELFVWAELFQELDRIVQHATETIEIIAQPDRPTASDDSYHFQDVVQLAVDASDGLLANDTFPSATGAAQAHLYGNPDHGTVVLDASGSFVYKPNSSFDGSDEFQYYVVTDEATSDVATVTITGQLPPMVGVTIRAVDAQGQPLESVYVGQSFYVQGLVEDLRREPTDEPRGVYQVDVQLSFDDRYVTLDGEVEINQRYDAYDFGDALVQGNMIDLLGHSGLSQTGLGEKEVFRIPLVATAAGQANLEIEKIRNLSLMRFGDVPEHLAEFATTDIRVEAGSRWQNPANSMDTNNDGHVTPHDVLFGVNMLNRYGAAALDDTKMEINGKRIYLDSNGDNFHSPTDVRIIVNYLNRVILSTGQGGGGSEAEGEDEAAKAAEGNGDGTVGRQAEGSVAEQGQLRFGPYEGAVRIESEAVAREVVAREVALSARSSSTAEREEEHRVMRIERKTTQRQVQIRNSTSHAAEASPFGDEELIEQLEEWLRGTW